MSTVIRNTVYSSINIYFEYLIGLVISILIARSLGPDSYGIYSYLVKVAGIAIIVTNAGINTGAIKFIAEARAHNKEENIPGVYRFFARIQRLKTAGIVILLWLVNELFPGVLIDEQYQTLFYALLLAIVFKSAHMFRVGVFKGHERFDFLAFTVLIVAPANLLVTAIAMHLELDLLAFYLIFASVTLLYWLVSSLYLSKLNIIRKDAAPLSDALLVRMRHHLKIVSINSILGGLVLGQCEVLLLKHLVSNESVAFFSIAHVISSAALLLVPGVYSAVLFPVIARSVAGVPGQAALQLKTSTRYLYLLGLMVVAPTFYYAEDIVVMLYGESFRQAGLILGIMAVVGLMRSFNEPANAFLLSSDRQSTVLKLTVVSFVVSITLNLSLISLYGLQGAVLAYSCVTLFFTSVLVLLVYRYLNVLPDWILLGKATVAAVLALGPLMLLGHWISALWLPFIGFPLFGIVYPVLLHVCRAYQQQDYALMLTLANKMGPRATRVAAKILPSSKEN